ncbi:MAG: protein kinase, partial [Acidobacteriota bacterium]|nr:protein kinase [Acidobacteriota bacterium]
LEGQAIRSALRVLPDPQGTLDPEQVMSGALDPAFQPISALGPSAKAYWFKILLKNQTSFADWGIGFTDSPRFTLYSRDASGQVRQATNGLSIPRFQRLLPLDPNFVGLGLPQGETQAFYIRAESPLRWDGGVELYRLSWHQTRTSNRRFLLPEALAIILVMALYNLLLYGSLRDKSYLIYSAFLLCVWANVFVNSPLLATFGFPSRLVEGIRLFTGTASVLTFLQFTRQFLMSRLRFPAWDRFWKWYQAPIVVLAAGSLFFPSNQGILSWDGILVLFFIAGAILVLVFAFKAWRSGFVPARHYLQANLAFLSLFVLTTTPNLLGLDLGIWNYLSFKVGVVLQVVFFSLALGGRFRILAQEKEQQERQQIVELQRLTEEKNLELERKVLARTEELAQSNQKLVEAQTKLASLMDSPQTLLEDIPAWANAMAIDLQATLGLRHLGAYEIRDEALLPLRPAPSPPDLPQVMESLGANGRFNDTIVLPARGLSGELRGVVLAATPRPDLDSGERQLLQGFASHLGSALEMSQVRRRLATMEARQTATLEELHAQGIETLKLCPACGRCYPDSAATCERDGTALEARGVLPYRVLDRYRFTRLLGEGGMGTVYEARDEQLDRAVALKLMRPEFFHDVAARMRFQREIRTMAQVNHPNVVMVFDSGELGDGSMYLVMELLQGLDLGTLVGQHGPGTPAQVARLLRQGAAALDAAHRLQIVHRDIKPQNLILVPGPGGFQVKVLDFGLAKSLVQESTLTQTGYMMGTPAYMAPEQILGREADARSDAFAFATVAYEALLGRPPTRGASLPDTIHTILYEPAPAPSVLATWIPEAVDRAFAQALEKNPASRPRELTAWAETLACLLEGHPGVARGWPDPIPLHPDQQPINARQRSIHESLYPTAPILPRATGK